MDVPLGVHQSQTSREYTPTFETLHLHRVLGRFIFLADDEMGRPSILCYQTNVGFIYILGEPMLL
jgi:hypothetical protein